MVGRRRLDFCCLQETRWRGDSASCVRVLGVAGARYKFFWVGSKEGVSGVGVLLAEKWFDNVVQVRRISERLMVVRVNVGNSIVSLISVYAPQMGRTMEEKMDFYAALGKIMTEVGSSERVIICGDLNGHVGELIEGFEGVHGGNGYGARNLEGEMLLEFADLHSLMVANTWFTKDDSKKITYESGENRSVIDYVLVRKYQRNMVIDVSVINGEACIPQHKLLLCKIEWGECIRVQHM
jgi:hypothetical protein